MFGFLDHAVSVQSDRPFARRKWCGQRLNRIRNPELKPYVSPEALQSMGQRELLGVFTGTTVVVFVDSSRIQRPIVHEKT